MSKLIRVSDEVFERLLKRDPHPQTAIAKLVYNSMALDDPLETAHIYGYLSNHTFATLSYYRHFKTIRHLLDWPDEELAMLKHIGAKSMDQIRTLRRLFLHNMPPSTRRPK